MALCPFAVKKLIPPGASDPRITPRIMILHVDAGNAESLFEYFRDRSGGVESHFFVRKDGVLEQYRDTDWQADANNLANDFAISVETQGFGDGEWTEEQLDTLKRLSRWVHEVHSIPFQVTPTWNGRGFGYHVQFGAPGPWTPVAKSCPGKLRVNQFNNIIAPWLNAGGQQPQQPTLNISQALQAKDAKERKEALRKIVKFGSDEASAAAKTWLTALKAVEEARAAAKAARIDLKELEVKV